MKCVERHTDCVYDTIEGMSRTASLRSTNEELQAKVEKYKEMFDELLHNNPSKQTTDRIQSLGLSPKASRSTEGAEEQPNEESASSTGQESHLRPISDPSQTPFPVFDLSSPPMPRAKWPGDGYDPNDGRISGRQDGWHHVLVVKASREIVSSGSTNESEESEYHTPIAMDKVTSLCIWALIASALICVSRIPNRTSIRAHGTRQRG